MDIFRNVSRQRHQPGIAIVVVITLMSLLALLVMAFLLLSSTNRNSTSLDVAIRQADSLAEQAKETVLMDLIGEMRAGSTSISTTPDGKTAYQVENPKSMVATRAVKASVQSDAKLERLIKQSAKGVNFHNGVGAAAGKIRASDVSTSTVDLGGRKISEIRWSAPRLFEPGTTMTPDQIPDWVYITRNGVNPITFNASNRTALSSGGAPNPDYVVGRYAYQVYDVSGLLDINVAGYNSAAASGGMLPRKGSLMWADLSQLPGASSGISSIVDWRRASSGSQQADVFVREWEGLKGWMRTPLVNNQSDNVFLTRKELIEYQKKNESSFPQALLSYLTVHGQALNQPSWGPSLNAGSGFDYKSKMDNSDAVNRRFPGVRVQGAFTRRNGNQAKVGEPLVISRFPLSRIRAFTDKNLEDVRNYFGLVPAVSAGSTTIAWSHANSSGGLIKKLAQVAAENREPDFFETLKAGILEGSVGNRMSANSFFLDLARDDKTDYQILRIGASIIDQWDVDDNPTIIQYGALNPLTNVRPDDVAGVENLPYFHFLTESRFRRRDTGAPPNDSTACTFINFQLWNPHKNVVDGKIATGSYRIAFAGTSRMRWHTFPRDGYADPGYNPYIRESPNRTATFANDYLQFTVDSSASFAQPIYMKPGKAGVTASKPALDQITGGGAPVIGYNVGEVSAPYAGVSHADRYNKHGLFVNYDVPMSFALQKNVAGTWVTYQLIPEWNLTHGFVVGSLVDNSNRLYAAAGDYVNLHMMLADPRTTRYGAASTSGGMDLINKTTAGRGYDNKFFPPSTWTTPGPPLRRISEQYVANDSGSATKIVHRDGIRRPADGGSPFVVPAQRPEILNRPFQSVAEIGYAFRDDPWTTINLFGDPQDPTNPGDGALLDLFSLTETPVRAGVVNPNRAPVAVLKALLVDAAIREGANLTQTMAGTYAQAIRTALDTEPLLSAADIAKLAAKVATAASIPGFANNKDIQVITRALADTANVRTWNLLVDVIAQSGKLPPGASGLDKFTNLAERRYWYHVSIDRFTGEVVHISRENPFE